MPGPTRCFLSPRLVLSARLVPGAAALVLAATACSGGEEPRPFDLSESRTTSTVAAEPVGVDPNAGARSQAQGFAEQQCLDDPSLGEGVVQIAEQDSGEVVNQIVADCDDVRARADAGEPVGNEIIPESLQPSE